MRDRNVIVERMPGPPTASGRTELVERKGIGHPDSIADGIAEAVSRALSRRYMEECGGEILHHNVDQNEVSGGQSVVWFGGGEVLEPPYILLLGRAVDEAVFRDGHRVRLPVRQVAVRAAREYLKENFHDPALVRDTGFDVSSDTIIDCRTGKGSQDLLRNYQRDAGLSGPHPSRPANDTSFGLGFAPLTPTERLVREIGHYMEGGMRTRDGITAAGKDIKVMAARDGDRITLTVACAMIASRVSSAAEYRVLMEQMVGLLEQEAAGLTEHEVEVVINHADVGGSDNVTDHYVTVTGLSMENGDDGSVGRGNRVNGLITPYRPMSLEAAAGKNPVSHVGKLYNVLANRIACRISTEAGTDISEVRVRLLSQIGSPIERPAMASVELCAADDAAYERWKGRAAELTALELEDIGGLTQQIVYGHIAVF
ncbi:MAG: methionine adenosyltransferase [Methanomassiliicoccus sp.]|nr:methionine adenosyltransferase [Methanomassiliicoccus sp.]